jgi:hypothetical protein
LIQKIFAAMDETRAHLALLTRLRQGEAEYPTAATAQRLENAARLAKAEWGKLESLVDRAYTLTRWQQDNGGCQASVPDAKYSPIWGRDRTELEWKARLCHQRHNGEC